VGTFGSAFLEGLTLTCPGFYAPQGRRLRYELKFDNYLDHLSKWKKNQVRITNFEMETSAIYALSNLLGHKAISLNAIIANRAIGKFSSNPKKLIEKLIQETLRDITDQL